MRCARVACISEVTEGHYCDKHQPEKKSPKPDVEAMRLMICESIEDLSDDQVTRVFEIVWPDWRASHEED